MMAEQIPRGERSNSVGNFTAQRDAMIAQNSAARDSLARLADLRSKQSTVSISVSFSSANPYMQSMVSSLSYQ